MTTRNAIVDPQGRSWLIASPTVLEGGLVRFEPLGMEHLGALAEVALAPQIWRWMPMHVETEADLALWIEHALAEAAKGTALPFVTRELATGRIVGSTRYMNIDAAHYGLEIGGSWLGVAYQRSGINVEAKYLQLRHAFEVLGAIRVCLKTHHENKQSQAAIAKLGATREGIFRNHMIMPDGSFRHSVWYAILQEEWPDVKSRLEARMAQYK